MNHSPAYTYLLTKADAIEINMISYINFFEKAKSFTKNISLPLSITTKNISARRHLKQSNIIFLIVDLS